MPAIESAAIEQDDRRYNHTKMFGTKAKNEKGDPTDVCAGDSGDFLLLLWKEDGIHLKT